MKKLNFIFTGPYLKFWYIAFIVIVALMAFNHLRLSKVNEYTLTIYDNSGNIADQREVTADQIKMLENTLPMTKSYTPHK